MGVEPCVVPPTSRQRAGSQGPGGQREGCPGGQDSAQVRKSSCTRDLYYLHPGIQSENTRGDKGTQQPDTMGRL